MTPVEAEIRRRIEIEGPVPLAIAMAQANAHYYATRDPLGVNGDFITAPEISQIFGELVGLWAAVSWAMMGRPSPILLVELGPGRGTLMADALRGLRIAPAFLAAVQVHLVETSPVLRAAQDATLAASGITPHWHDRVEDIPAGPAVFIANEFFDALPVHQYTRTPEGWRERAIGIGDDGALRLGLTPYTVPDAAIPESLRWSPAGTLVETSPATTAIMASLGARLAAQGGGALIVDYGHAQTSSGETLQALKEHVFHDILDDLGEADMTAHVDFQALAGAAAGAGLTVHGPVSQHDFLFQLGIMERATILKRQASAEQAATIESGVQRLMDTSPAGMGTLFKVLAVTASGLPTPAGFATMVP